MGKCVGKIVQRRPEPKAAQDPGFFGFCQAYDQSADPFAGDLRVVSVQPLPAAYAAQVSQRIAVRQNGIHASPAPNPRKSRFDSL